MSHVNLTALRADTASRFDRIAHVATRRNHAPLVVMTLAAPESLEETSHPLGSPANAGHPRRRSIASFGAGRTEEHDPIRP